MRRTARSIAFLTILLGLAEIANAGSIVADFTTLGSVNAPSVSVGGIVVTGSANVTAGLNPGLGSTGLGIAGGGGDASLDLGETMTIDYGQLVKNVTLNVFDIPTVGDVGYQFQAFNGATSLGTFAFPLQSMSLETKDLSALAGGIEFSKITLSILVSQATPLGLIIERTTYDLASTSPAVPEPASWAMIASGFIPMLGVAWYRRKARRAAAA